MHYLTMNKVKYLFSTAVFFSTCKYYFTVCLFHPMQHMKTFRSHPDKALRNLI